MTRTVRLAAAAAAAMSPADDSDGALLCFDAGRAGRGVLTGRLGAAGYSDLVTGLGLGSGSSSSFGGGFGLTFASRATRGTCGLPFGCGAGEAATGASAFGVASALPRGVALGDAAWRGLSLTLASLAAGEATLAGGVSPFGFAAFTGALAFAGSAFAGGADGRCAAGDAGGTLALGEGAALVATLGAAGAFAFAASLALRVGLSGLAALDGGAFAPLAGRGVTGGDFASGVLLRSLAAFAGAFGGDFTGLSFAAGGTLGLGALAPALLFGDGEVGLLPFSGVRGSSACRTFGADFGAFASF